MKILVLGDIHEQTANLEKIASDLASADLTIIHGDLTTDGGRDRAREIVAEIRSKTESPVLAQPGNMDRSDATEWFAEEGIDLHGRGRRYEDIGIVGVGGSNPTPFRTPTEFSEEEIEAVLAKAIEEVGDVRVLILISHAPPKDTNVDRVGADLHVGSEAVRRFIEKHEPAVCVSGHIHEARGQDRLGSTDVLNTGMLAAGGYVVIETTETGATAELRLLEKGAD